jgi:hypothetical protein
MEIKLLISYDASSNHTKLKKIIMDFFENYIQEKVNISEEDWWTNTTVIVEISLNLPYKNKEIENKIIEYIKGLLNPLKRYIKSKETEKTKFDLQRIFIVEISDPIY